MPKSDRKKSIVIIGGGTGIYPVLQGLKEYHEEISIKAIISMTDSGGSNARIRDEFGLLPLSDINRALSALATDVETHDELLRRLFLYRFEKGNGISGHNFGNLLLVALTDLLGSETEAIKAAGRILRVRGEVLPITEDHVELVAEYDDGVIVVGEHDIDEPEKNRTGHKIVQFRAEPQGRITQDAKTALKEADLILIGPGDLYSSLLANCVIGGMDEALRNAPGKFIYAVNLMTRPGQTDSMSACAHIKEIERYTGRTPDIVIINTGTVPKHLLLRYAEFGQLPVHDDGDDFTGKIIRADLLHSDEVVKSKSDVLVRSLVRGDGDKFAELLMSLL